MSLLQLLSSGKSLVGIHADGRKFEVNPRRLLPKFNTRKNPFRAKAAEESAPSEPTAATPSTQTVKPSGAGKTAAVMNYLKTVVWGRAAQWAKRCAAKGGSWAPKFRKSAKPAIPQFTKPAVQCELRLATVKVMRNDLSDSDLEVVAVKAAAPAAPEPGEAVKMTERSESGATWNRIGSRLFGAGRTLT